MGYQPIHDFQSCALDQLSHLSVFFLPSVDSPNIISQNWKKIKPFLKKSHRICKNICPCAYFLRFILENRCTIIGTSASCSIIPGNAVKNPFVKNSEKVNIFPPAII